MAARDPIEALKARWRSDGVPIRPGASPEAIAAFEARHGVVLSPALRAYFEGVDGMVANLDDWEQDGEIYRFWPLAALVPIRDFEPSERNWPDWAGRWFGFVDFLINSHAYAVRLAADPGQDDPVALWDFGGGLYASFPTFARFLETYLDDPHELVGYSREQIED